MKQDPCGSRGSRRYLKDLQSQTELVFVTVVRGVDLTFHKEPGTTYAKRSDQPRLKEIIMDANEANNALNRDPDMDPAFGPEGGYFFPKPGTRSDIGAVVLGSDESLYLASLLEDGTYEFNHTSALGFTIDGFKPTISAFAENGESRPTRLLLQTDGKIVMIGTFTTNGTISRKVSRPAIARFNADGTLDPVFKRQVLLNGPENAIAPLFQRKMADGCLQADGKILIAGSYQLPDPNSVNYFSKLTRLNSDGTEDSSFGEGGSIDVVFPNAQVDAPNVQVQSDGKIIVGGITDTHKLLLARYTADGKLDPNFGDAGYFLYNHFDRHTTLLNSFIVYQDKILCAGRVVGTKGGALLLRVTANGHIDPEFNGGEPVLTQEPFTAFEWIKLATQTDGSIVVVSARDCVIRRFLKEGQPDNSFVWATKPLRCSDIAIQHLSKRLIVTAKDNGGSALVLGLLSSSKVHK